MQLRDLSLKLTRLLRYVIVGLIALTLLSWALPCFTYSGVTDKEVRSTMSLWGVIGFTEEFPQIAALLNIKYVKLATLSVPVLMIATGIIGLIACLMKKGLGTTILPLIFSVYGLYGYFTDDFLGLINHSSSYIIHIILIALTLVATLVAIVFNIIELKTRPADYYLPKIGV